MKQNINKTMKELDKTKVYSLEDLTSEERNEVDNYIKIIQPEYNTITVDEYSILEYKKYNEWCYWHKENSIKYNYQTTNAKELFYTLENIQVDCRELSDEQIKEMADVFKANGYKIWEDYSALDVCDVNYLLEFTDGEVFVSIGSEDKTTITYEKFMELFDNKLPPYKKASLKWNYSTLVGGAIETKEHHIKELTKEILQPMGTLEQQLEKAEAEVKRLKEAIEDSKIKDGDWCMFYNHDKSKSIIAKFQGSKFACITSGDYFLNCEKITDSVLLEILNKMS